MFSLTERCPVSRRVTPDEARAFCAALLLARARETHCPITPRRHFRSNGGRFRILGDGNRVLTGHFRTRLTANVIFYFAGRLKTVRTFA